MQRSKMAVSNQASTTAPSVAHGLIRFLEKHKELEIFFDSRELGLLKHITRTATKAESSYLRKGISKVIYGVPYVAQSLFFNTLIVPEYDAIIGTRKLYIREKLHAAIANGAQQIIVLGGGYDTAAFFASLNYGVNVFECDIGQTRLNKLEALLSIPKVLGMLNVTCQDNEYGACVVNKNFYSIECDITNDLAASLLENGFQKNVKTFVYGEGVLPYLTDEGVQSVLQDLQMLLTNQDEVLLGILSHTNCSAALKKALKSAGEEANFALLPEKVCAYLNPRGFVVTEKSFMETRLGFVFDEAVIRDDLHPKLQHEPQEQYYLLQPTGQTLEEIQDLNKVPEFELSKKNLEYELV